MLAFIAIILLIMLMIVCYNSSMIKLYSFSYWLNVVLIVLIGLALGYDLGSVIYK